MAGSRSYLRAIGKHFHLIVLYGISGVLSLQVWLTPSLAGDATLNSENNLSIPKWGFLELEPLGCNPQAIMDLNSPANVYRGEYRRLTQSDNLDIVVIRVAFLDQSNSMNAEKNISSIVKRALELLSLSKDSEVGVFVKESTEVVTLDQTFESLGPLGRNNFKGLAELTNTFLEKLSHRFDLSDVDILILVSPSGIRYSQLGASIALLSYGKFPSAIFLGTDFWQSAKPWTLVAHELGHIFGLLDLYDMENSMKVARGLTAYQSQFAFMGPFDVMNNPSGTAPELTIWNRWLLGSVSRDNIYCFQGKLSKVLLRPVAIPGKGYRGIFFKESETSLIIIENRQALRLDRSVSISSRGLLIYHVDLLTDTGSGPLRVLVKGLCGRLKEENVSIKNLQVSCFQEANHNLSVRIKSNYRK